MVTESDIIGRAPKVLVTGANGQVGRELVSRIGAKGWLPIGVGHRSGDQIDAVVDIANSEAVDEAVVNYAPDVIIHAAAMTDVEACEKFPELAYSVNHIGAQNVAQAATKVGAWVISISTDFVFSGIEPPYLENAVPSPISVYGASKLAGEQSVLAVDRHNAIVRTAWVYGGSGKHFPRTVLDLLHRNDTINVVEDEQGSPTYAPDLAQALVDLIEYKPSGVFHLTNNGTTSRYQMAVEVATLAGLDADRVQPTTTEEFLQTDPLLAKRPKDSTLVNIRASQLGVQLRSWKSALAAYMPVLIQERQQSAGDGH